MFWIRVFWVANMCIAGAVIGYLGIGPWIELISGQRSFSSVHLYLLMGISHLIASRIGWKKWVVNAGK